MTVGEFIEYVKENNIPEDYEIIIKYWSDGDYDYGYNTTYTNDYIADVDKENKTISLEV